MDGNNAWGMDVNAAKLFILPTDGESEWTTADVALMWRHLMSRPILLECELSQVELGIAHDHEINRRAEIASFGEILFGDEHDRESIEWVRRYAKDHIKGDYGLPRDVATVLYYCVVAKARGLGPASVTRLSMQEQLDGYNWCLDQAWIDSRTEVLLKRARDELTSRN